MKRMFIVGVLALVSSLVTVAACKQDEGGRCQVDDDCQSGLVCNKATNICSSSSGGAVDADIIDAVPADAAVDAVPDAP